MKHVDASDDLVDDFEPSKIQLGPDGAPQIPPQKAGDEPPPRLCEAGPCVHYHRFGIQLDAARPIAAKVEPGGKLTGQAPPMPFYTRIHHYCYPTVGVETKLGDMPVLECNRWKPINGDERDAMALDQLAYLETEAGKEFEARLEAWKAQKMKEATDQPESGELDDAVLFVTMHMVDDGTLFLYPLGDEGEGRHVAYLNPATAREVFDLNYLKNTFGGGSWVACIDRDFIDDQTQEPKHVRIARKIFEVTP